MTVFTPPTNDTTKVAKAGDTMTGSLVISGATSDLTVGRDLYIGGASGVRAQYRAGTALDVLIFDGVVMTAHDSMYIYAADMHSNGTFIGEEATDAGIPRWSLADAATQRVKFMREIPAEWDTIAVRFGWAKEDALSGNVDWTFNYAFYDAFAGQNVDTLAGTAVAVGSIAVPAGQFALKYELPVPTEALAVADGTFGSKPWIRASLSRAGAADTYNGAVSVIAATITRTAPT